MKSSESHGVPEEEKILPKAEKERPIIHIDIRNKSHRNAEDAEDIAALLPNYDVYVPEKVGWDESVLYLYQQVSNGTLRPETAILSESPFSPYYEFHHKELEALYGSHKTIAFLDIQDDNPLKQQTEERLRSFVGIEASKLNFHATLEELRVNFQNIAEVFKKRLEHLYQECERMIETLSQDGEDLPKNLRGKTEIKILMSLGKADTLFFHLLKRNGIDAKNLYSETKHSLIDEITRRFEFDKDVSTELLARSWLASRIYRILSEKIIDTQYLDDTIRQIASSFTFKEIKDIFNSFRADNENEGIIIEAIKKKGFDFDKVSV